MPTNNNYTYNDNLEYIIASIMYTVKKQYVILTRIHVSIHCPKKQHI